MIQRLLKICRCANTKKYELEAKRLFFNEFIDRDEIGKSEPCFSRVNQNITAFSLMH